MLFERVLRRLGVRRLIDEHLPKRSPLAKYAMVEGVYSLMAAQLLEGHGIGVTEFLRRDNLAGETVHEMVGRKSKVLGLFDAAYFERDVIERLRALG